MANLDNKQKASSEEPDMWFTHEISSSDDLETWE